MRDREENRRIAFALLGSSNYSKTEREANDFYATDPQAMDALLAVEDFSMDVWEPACGMGHLAKVLTDRGYSVKATDLIDRGYGESGVDFLETPDTWSGDIITNPPYKYAQEFAEQALRKVRSGGKVALLLKLLFLEGQKRRKLFDVALPARIHVFSKRLRCAKGANFDTGNDGVICFAWFVWIKGFQGKPIIDWI